MHMIRNGQARWVAAMLFANRTSSSIGSSIWRSETAAPDSSRGLLRQRFQSCNTSSNTNEQFLHPTFGAVHPQHASRKSRQLRLIADTLRQSR